ncbi:MFS transporter [Streptomyces sp. NPDC001514]
MTTPQPTPIPQTTAPERGDGSGRALLVIASCQLMVVLDITIVNIALPHIQASLDLSTANLSWVVSAYTLTFGGLLLLGGRSGDILGRRRVFVLGVLLFVIASLLGGLARNSALLLAARALQGAGAAIASPTALALISTTFREGPERSRAFGVFAAVSAGGGAIGLLAGGMLVEWLDWRWVFFVNVPIGLLIAAAAPRRIRESERHPGTFDLTGALTSTAGMVLLVYGFIRAAQDGWRDGLTVASFVASIAILAVFVLVERRSGQPITPLHMFADRNRAGAYGMMLSLAAAMFGVFFFLTLFVQNVLGFGPLQAGFAFLPVSTVIAVGAGTASRLLPRFGPKPFLVTGALLATTGLAWLSRIDVDSTYPGSILGPILVFSLGMGLQFVSLTLTALSNVAARESGAAAGLLSAHQQLGGSLGLAVLVTVFGAAAGNEAGKQVASQDILTAGVSTAFAVAAVFMAIAALIALLVVRVRPSDIERLNGGAGPRQL